MATHFIPALFAAVMPTIESSKTTHSEGSTPKMPAPFQVNLRMRLYIFDIIPGEPNVKVTVKILVF